MAGEERGLDSHAKANLKPRRFWLAALANVIFPPLGHVYAGRPLRGVVLVFIVALFGLGALSLALRPVGLTTVVLMGLILIIAYATPIVDAVIVATRWGEEYRLKRYNRWYVYLLVFVIVAAVGNIVRPALRSHVVQAYRLPSGSMIPTLLMGDYILTDKTAYKSRSPERFEVVVFEFPEDRQKTFVDRVIGLPGETIEIRDKMEGVESFVVCWRMKSSRGRGPANTHCRNARPGPPT